MRSAKDAEASLRTSAASDPPGDNAAFPSKAKSIRHWFFRDPPWLIRDGLLALVIGVLLVGVQFYLDERRSDREQAIESGRAALAERLENLRYVRERADDQESPEGTRRKIFNNLDLVGMNLSRLDLSDSIFSGANLDRTDFTSADLTGSTFGAASFDSSGSAHGAVFNRAKFRNSNFSNWNGNGANFSGAQLHGTFFNGGSYVGTDFARASLEDVHFFVVDLSQALNLESAFIERGCHVSVKWPAGFSPPEGSGADCDPKLSG